MKFVRNWGRLGMKFDEYRFDEITLNYDKERIPFQQWKEEKGKVNTDIMEHKAL